MTNITGGTVNAFQAISNSVTNFRGGTLPDSRLLASSTLNLFDGSINGTVFHLSSAATANFYGQSVAFTNAMVGTVPAQYGTGDGVYYDVAWTRANGDLLNTRYFDLNGNVNNAVPGGVTFTQTVAVPETGTALLAGIGFVLGTIGTVCKRRADKR